MTGPAYASVPEPSGRPRPIGALGHPGRSLRQELREQPPPGVRSRPAGAGRGAGDSRLGRGRRAPSGADPAGELRDPGQLARAEAEVQRR